MTTSDKLKIIEVLSLEEVTIAPIGTSCYYNVSEFIGGKFKCVASGKTFDVFEYWEE
jgi:hypothetical protein